MINSTLCYLEKDGAYLMLHRIKKKKDLNKDKWIGVGGKFEDKESPEDCLRREVSEETGLTLTSWRFRGIVTFVSDEADTEYMYLFTADGFEGEMIRGDACSEGALEWVPVEKIPSLNLWAGDRIFLRLLAENAPFFSLKLSYEGSTLVGVAMNGHTVPPCDWNI
jgi:8-oxo-dGTP diphosphatase